MANQQGERIRAIDGIRGVAIVLVFLFHYINNQLTGAGNIWVKSLAFVTGFGWVGVDLFFVLSGFLIGRIILKNLESTTLYKTFFVRRVLKIVPTYYLFLLCFFLVSNLHWFSKSHFLVGTYDIPIGSYFLMCHNIFMGIRNSMGNDALSVTWSIGIEEQFYLVIPFLLSLFRKRIELLLVMLVFISWVSRSVFDSWIPRYVLLNCRLDSLAIGIFVARIETVTLYRSYYLKWQRLFDGLLLGLVACIGILYISFGDLGVVKHTLFALVFALVIGNTIFRENYFLARFFSYSWLVKIGEISYSLYLFHYFILGVVMAVFGKQTIGISSAIDVLITVLSAVVAFFVASFVYRRFESKFTSFGRKFSY